MSRLSLGGLASGMDTDNMIEQLMKAQRYKVDRYKKRNMSNDYRQEEWKKMNAKIYSFFNKELTSVRLKANLIKHKAVSSNTSVVDVQATAAAQKGTHDVEVLALAKTASTASGKLLTALGTDVTSETTMQDMGLDGKDFTITYKDAGGVEQTITVTAEATDTLRGFAEKIKKESKGKLDMEANVDIKNGRLFLATKNSGEKQSFRLGGDIATAFGFSTAEIKGQDAKYRYNGVEFTSENNEAEINGLKLTLRSLGQTTVSVSRDVDGAYKQVVDFLKQYNVLVTDMQDKVNVTVRRSERDMEPLTDEEKKGLSEADAKKWEETLRGRVFKNDKNLKEILGDMRTIFATTTVSDNGKYDALSTLGISTGDYKLNTGAMLFVDGDSELGGSRSERPNKLRQALEEDPEAVAELVSKLAQKLSDKLSDKMKSSTLRSYMSFYDDKAAQEEYRQVERRIQIMEDRLVDLEEKYRKQFAAMEKALSKSNSTSAWLTQQMSALR